MMADVKYSSCLIETIVPIAVIVVVFIILSATPFWKIAVSMSASLKKVILAGGPGRCRMPHSCNSSAEIQRHADKE
jgi:hypothetical protein